MSIADELRMWAEGDDLRSGATRARLRDQALDIAARIDAAHNVAVRTAYEDGLHKGQADAVDADWLEHGWVRGPIGADGEPMADEHMVVDNGGRVGVIIETQFDNHNWFVRVDFGEGRSDRFVWFLPKSLTHYHEPTVEDVLCELLDKVDDDRAGQAEIIAKYAAKLRLADDREE